MAIPQLKLAGVFLRSNLTAVKIIAVLLLIAALFFGGFYYGQRFADGEHAKARHAELVEKQKALDAEIVRRNELQAELNTLSQTFETFKQTIKPEVVYVTRRVIEEIEKPVYTQCVVPPSGVLLHNETVDRLNAARRDRS
ncbi:MAG: hypothetical protein DDT26_00307 [Dehalococcoidia bacterium]|nr:hypothetical protein [Chloroflexota bacterium]